MDENDHTAAGGIFYLIVNLIERFLQVQSCRKKVVVENRIIGTVSRQNEHGLGESCLNRLLQAD